jgi:cell division protease FtsH
MVYAENEGEIFLGRSVTRTTSISETTQQKVDSEIRRILDEQYAVAKQIIETNRDKIEAMTDALMKWETIDRDQVLDIMAGRPPRAPGEGSAPSGPTDGGGSPNIKPDSAPQAA